MIDWEAVTWARSSRPTQQSAHERYFARIANRHRGWHGFSRSSHCRSPVSFCTSSLEKRGLADRAERAAERSIRASQDHRAIISREAKPPARTGLPLRSRAPSIISDTTAGNSARLAADSNAAIDAMVADIDGACETVHGCFYIWLADNNGLKIKDALHSRRSARRAGAAASRRAGFAAVRSLASLARDARQRVRNAGGAARRQPAVDHDSRPGRPSQSPQAAGHRQSHRLVREPELSPTPNSASSRATRHGSTS